MQRPKFLLPHNKLEFHIKLEFHKFKFQESGRLLRACLDNKKSSLNFRHSIFITHHSSLITHISSLITHHSSLIFSHSFGNITFIFITQFFHTIHRSHTCQPVQFFFLSTQLTEANILKKKKKPEQPTQEKKKKMSKGGQKLRLWVPYVCLITIFPLSYELWKLKTAKSYFQFP